MPTASLLFVISETVTVAGSVPVFRITHAAFVPILDPLVFTEYGGLRS
jgi:hypothetical protein